TDFCFTTNALAKNRRYAEAYGFRGLLAPPGLVMNVVFSQSVEDVSENGRANLEYIDMRFGAPVCVGDTIEAESTVLGVKASARARHHDRAHRTHGHARQHLAGALEPVDDRPGPRALPRRAADRVRRHPLLPLPRALLARRRRQRARRRPLRDRAAHGAGVRGR